MKDVTDILLIGNDGLLEINKKEIRTLKEFNAILTRDKGSEGDFDGRKKFFAFKELMYIYLYSHPSSVYRDKPDEARHSYSVEHADLPTNWKPDAIIRKAQEKFLKLVNMSALYHSYINANRAVYATGTDIEFFNNLRDGVRTKIITKTKELDAAVIEEDIQRLNGEIDYLTNRLLDLGGKISTISANLPKAFETIEGLKQKLLNESGGGGKIYGGGDLNNREA